MKKAVTNGEHLPVYCGPIVVCRSSNQCHVLRGNRKKTEKRKNIKKLGHSQEDWNLFFQISYSKHIATFCECPSSSKVFVLTNSSLQLIHVSCTRFFSLSCSSSSSKFHFVSLKQNVRNKMNWKFFCLAFLTKLLLNTGDFFVFTRNSLTNSGRILEICVGFLLVMHFQFLQLDGKLFQYLSDTKK